MKKLFKKQNKQTNKSPIFGSLFMFISIIYFLFTNSSSGDNEDSDMKVCKVFLVLDLQIKTQREGTKSLASTS